MDVSAPAAPSTDGSLGPPRDLSADPVDRPSERRGRLTQFRRANVLIGFVASSSLMLGNSVYFLTTADQPNRPLLWAIQFVAIAIGIITLVIARRWMPLRPLIHVWTTSQLLLISFAAALDGGHDSPLLVLLFVPLGMAALALRPRAVAVHALTAIAGLVAIGATTGTLSIGPTLIWGTALAAIALTGTAVTQNTRRLTRRLGEVNQELFELSRRDALTGCLNHRSFYEEIDLALARALRSHVPIALLLLDVDHFKRVNDAHGHPAGDEVLVALADALRTSTRAGDVVARTGGEEFAVLMPDTGLQGAEHVAERVREAVANAGGPVAVTVSAGLAAFPAHGSTSAQLVRVADEALYAAKAAGRDRLVTAP